MPVNPLRNLPSIGELLEYPALKRAVNRVTPNVVVARVRSFLDELRQDLQTVAHEVPLPSVSELAERIVRRLQLDERPRLRPVINATGILLHPDLGGPPLAEAAVEEMVASARDYTSIGFDLLAGSRSSPCAAVQDLLAELCGCESALALHSHASAVWLTLAALAGGREALISRGEVVEIDGARLPDLAAAAGVTLRELGSTHHVERTDYERAFSAASALVLRMQPTDYAIVGMPASALAHEDLAELARHKDCPLVHDVGYGGLLDVSELGLAAEPTIPASITAGSDIVLASGDKLLGGPRCGLIVGRRSWVERIAVHPLAAALSADPSTLSALAGTLRLSRQADLARREIPLWRLLDTPAANLRGRAERMAPQLAACSAIRAVEVIEATTYLGPAPIEARRLATCCVALEPKSGGMERLSGALRVGTPSVVGRNINGRLCFDLRSVLPRQDMLLIEAVAALGGVEPGNDVAAPTS